MNRAGVRVTRATIPNVQCGVTSRVLADSSWQASTPLSRNPEEVCSLSLRRELGRAYDMRHTAGFA